MMNHQDSKVREYLNMHTDRLFLYMGMQFDPISVFHEFLWFLFCPLIYSSCIGEYIVHVKKFYYKQLKMYDGLHKFILYNILKWALPKK